MTHREPRVPDTDGKFHINESRQPQPFIVPVRPPPEQWPNWRDWIGTSRRDALELFPQRCYTELVVAHKIFNQRILVVSHPEMLREVFGSARKHYGLCNMHLRMLAPALGNGLIVAEGARWRLHRRHSLLFLKGAATEINSVDALLSVFVEYLSKQSSAVDISSATTEFAFGLLAQALFQYNTTELSPRLLGDIQRHRNIVEAADLLDVFGAPPWLISVKMIRARVLMTPYHNLIYRSIGERAGVVPKEFRRVDSKNFAMNLMAGYESIAATLLWALLILAHNQTWWEWLSAGSPVTARPERVSMFIKEVLRLYPPLPLVFRKARDTQVTPIGVVRKGTILCLSPFLAQRHAENWKDPHQFNPLRYHSAEARAGTYLPFGLGARQCVGQDLAMKLLTKVLLRLTTTLRPRPGQADIPLPRAGLSLRPASGALLAFEVVGKVGGGA